MDIWTQKSWPGVLGSLMERPQHPGSLACLSHTVDNLLKQQGRTMGMSEKRRWVITDKQGGRVYGKQLDQGERSS